jgi:chromosome segregation ATPase
MAEKLIWAEVDKFQLSFQSFASDIRSKQNRIDALQDKLQASQLEVKKYQDNQDQTLASVLQSKEDTIGALQEQLRATELQVKKYQDVFCKKKQERKKTRRASYKGIM